MIGLVDTDAKDMEAVTPAQDQEHFREDHMKKGSYLGNSSNNLSSRVLLPGVESPLPEDEEYRCSGLTEAEVAYFHFLSFWVVGVVQVVVSAIGIFGNCISMSVLCSRMMSCSIFNRLLVFLAIFDNIHLILTILDSAREVFGDLGTGHLHTYVYFLFPLHNANLCCSIYMTTVLAMERYLAVSEPVEYHNVVNSGRKWPRILRYVVPVVTFSILFNAPKFMELRVSYIKEPTMITNSNGTNTTIFVERAMAVPTDLRLNADYVIYYLNHARLLVTGIIPFVALVFFNYNIWRAVRRRRSVLGPVAMAAHAAHAAEENRQALMLFTIVVVFLVCHTPRNFLNLNETLNVEQVMNDYKKGCSGLPLNILLIGIASHLLLAINSSLNFFLYCVMSSSFRNELSSILTKVLTGMDRVCCHQIRAKMVRRARHRRDSNNSRIGNIDHLPDVPDEQHQSFIPLQPIVNGAGALA